MVSGYRLRLEISYAGVLKGGHLQLDPKEVIEARFFDRHALPDGLLRSHREIIALAYPDTLCKESSLNQGSPAWKGGE
jgi:hypothetical protein